MMTSTFLFLLSFMFFFVVAVYFYAFKKGKEKLRNDILEKEINDTIESNKDIAKRRTDSINVIRDRLSKYSRKE